MNNRDFTYWMEGFFEISEPKVISEKQTKMIKEHLKLVKAIEPLSGFPLWLDGFLSSRDLSEDTLYLSERDTKFINAELRKQITNVMDGDKFSTDLLDSAKRRASSSSVRYC